MKFKGWYLGVTMAAFAAMMAPKANATLATPDFTNGFSGPVDIKFTGNTAEDSLAGIPGSPTFGASCTGAGGSPPCSETTFGAGVLTSVTEHSNPAIQLWTSGKNNEAVAFFMYGIADQSSTGSGSNITIYNTGANNGNVTTSGGTTFQSGGKFDGVIHIDMYVMDLSSAPCFVGAGCVSPTNRTAIDQMHGVTDVAGGSLIAQFIMVPGVVPNGTGGTNCPTGDNQGIGCITLQQNVNALSDPADGGGSFYLDCINGSACAEFAKDGFTANSYIADQFGKFTVSSVNPATNNNWEESITDPVEALPVPEPGSLAMLGCSLMLLGVAIRHRRRNGHML